MYLIGLISGILIVISFLIFKKIVEQSLIKTGTAFEVTFTVSYVNHPNGDVTKSQVFATRPITTRVVALDEEDARDFIRTIVMDEVRIEISEINQLDA